MADLPSAGTQEYLWWSQGAIDNEECHKLRTTAAKELRDVLEALDEQYGPPLTPERLVSELARIYCPERLRRKYRG